MAVARSRVRSDARLAALAELSPERAAAEFSACCASARWTAVLPARRPFETVSALYAAAAEESAALDWSDVLEALAAHPRIGERAAGTGVEARWSRTEQSGAANAPPSAAEALAAANAEYEAKFGFVFLI